MATLYSNNGNGNSHDRRRFPRYYVSAKLTLAIEDESLQESLGIGEPQDISLGGLRVTNLPSCPNVKVGDQLGLLLLDGEDALSLTGEVVHHATADTFGVSGAIKSGSESCRRIYWATSCAPLTKKTHD